MSVVISFSESNFSLAAKDDYRKIGQFLLENGANAETQDLFLRFPRDVASTFEVKYFLEILDKFSVSKNRE